MTSNASILGDCITMPVSSFIYTADGSPLRIEKRGSVKIK